MPDNCPSDREATGRDGGISHTGSTAKSRSDQMSQRQHQQIKTIVFLFGTKTKVLYNNTVFDMNTDSWYNYWWHQRIKASMYADDSIFFLCKLFLNVWKTETRKSDYTLVLESNPWLSNSGNLWTLCWLVLQRKRTRGILNTRRHTRRHVTKHRLNINMLVPHLCSKYKNTGSSLEINNLPLQIAFYCCYCK